MYNILEFLKKFVILLLVLIILTWVVVTSLSVFTELFGKTKIPFVTKNCYGITLEDQKPPLCIGVPH
jgi:hypothetical protein